MLTKPTSDSRTLHVFQWLGTRENRSSFLEPHGSSLCQIPPVTHIAELARTRLHQVATW